MRINSITNDNRKKVISFFKEHWGSSEMVISSGVFQCDRLDGFIFEEHNQIKGLVTYVTKENEIEVISLDSIQERKGIGSALMEKVEQIAKQEGLNEVNLVTTNDNLQVKSLEKPII